MSVLRQSYKRIHFLGVGGAGVSALAHLMLQEGRTVTGSDCCASDVTEGLIRAGATIWIGHDESHVRRVVDGRQADLVVYSTACKSDNPELAYAVAAGIPTVTRQQFLTYCAMRKNSIVVSGSHGKSTTSSMLATAFIAAGLDPSIVLGSQLRHDMGTQSADGTSSARHGHSEWFICEGDESNNSMLEIAPRIAVVTNIDYDHMDFHGSLTNLKRAFLRFLNSPGPDGMAIVCLDDLNIRSLLGSISSRVVSYGFSREADYFAVNERAVPGAGISFEVHHRERGPLGTINLDYPGRHNILNSLAVLAISQEIGLQFGIIATALESFPGVKRRYERLFRGRVELIDDYAHHPSEIQALLGAVRDVFPERRLRVIFQPHRFTRSKNLAQQFPPAFQLADEIVLAPIYTAFEAPIPGVGVDYLNRFFQRRYDEHKLVCLGELREIEDYIYDTLADGDVVMTVGAGTVNLIGYALAERLQAEDQPGVAIDLQRLSTEVKAEPLPENHA